MKYFKRSKYRDRAESSVASDISRSELSEVRHDRAERRLLKELARRNEEVAMQREQLGKLHTEVTRIAELQAAQKKQMHSLEKEHKVELRNLHKQVEEERSVKHAIEVELATLMDRCNELVHENKLNEMQQEKHEHEQHGEPSNSNEVQSTLGDSSQGNQPEELQKLKGRMEVLEESMKESVPYHEDEELERQKMLEYEAKASLACEHVKKDLGRLKKWVSWKWRWAAEALKSDIMSKRLESNGGLGPGGRCTVCNKRKCVCTQSQATVVPAVMTTWRAYARAVRLEKKALGMISSLEKMVSALPWWIRRVGQRRLLERCFFRWELCALRRNKTPAQDGSTDGLTRKCSACTCKHDTDSKSSRKDAGRVSANGAVKHRKAWGSSSAKGDYFAWENQVRKKKTPSDFSRWTGLKRLQRLQGSIQKEVKELESQLSSHMQALKDDKDNKYAPKGPIWKGSCNATWEVCNSLIRTLTDARKQLGSADGKPKTPTPKYLGGKEQLLDIPGGYQQKIRNTPSRGPKSSPNKSQGVEKPVSEKQVTEKQGAEPHTVVEVPEACNLTLDPGASVNVCCPGDGKNGQGHAWDDHGRRICGAAQYAEYLRDEITKLKQWQLEHETDIKKELGGLGGVRGVVGVGKQQLLDVHPELEVCW